MPTPMYVHHVPALFQRRCFDIPLFIPDFARPFRNFPFNYPFSHSLVLLSNQLKALINSYSKRERFASA